MLALNLEEMQTTRNHYRDPRCRPLVPYSVCRLMRPRTEPASRANVSEHCKHKIFAAHIHHRDEVTGEDTEIDSLFKTYIMGPHPRHAGGDAVAGRSSMTIQA